MLIIVIEFVMDILETIVFIGSLFIVVYLFVLQPNQIKGGSMEPSFFTGEYILTSKVTYRFRSPNRGDVVVFKSPKNPDIEYVKRIIGLPGDKILIKNSDLYVNGNLIQENYIAAKTNLWQGGSTKEGEQLTIPPEEIFVMGDNRPRSSDSREFGPVPTASVIGYVFYRYYPPKKIGWVVNPWPKALRSTASNTPLTMDWFLPNFQTFQ